MARPLRIEFPGAVYHIDVRGNAGTAIFHDDTDRRHFLDLLGREVRQQRWLCHGFCLLDDGYRLVIETPEANLGRGLSRLNAVYSQAFNRRHGRAGHLLQGRYRAILMEKDAYLAAVCRDLALAPVRAKLVKKPGQWRWSSHRALAKNKDRPPWLTTEDVLSRFLGAHPDPAKAYRDFVTKVETPPSPLNAVRAQMYLGGEGFRAAMRERIRGVDGTGVARAALEPARPTAEEVVRAVAELAGLPPEQVFDRRHRQDVYQATVYLLRRAASLPLREVAGMAGVSPGRVSQIQRHIEDEGGLGRAIPWGRPLLRLMG